MDKEEGERRLHLQPAVCLWGASLIYQSLSFSVLNYNGFYLPPWVVVAWEMLKTNIRMLNGVPNTVKVPTLAPFSQKGCNRGQESWKERVWGGRRP